MRRALGRLSPSNMNFLSLGLNKYESIIRKLQELEEPYLLIDDGTIIDALEPDPAHVVFDYSKHGLNPLKGMDYFRALDFMSLINAIYPEGRETLTRKDFEHGSAAAVA